jgi:hypothetical protein
MTKEQLVFGIIGAIVVAALNAMQTAAQEWIRRRATVKAHSELVERVSHRISNGGNGKA